MFCSLGSHLVWMLASMVYLGRASVALGANLLFSSAWYLFNFSFFGPGFRGSGNNVDGDHERI